MAINFQNTFQTNRYEIFNGLGVALVTPFNDNGAIDYNSMFKLNNHVIEGGVD